jgi:D-psicose/D-tagatose/L-ribulose 3-epimerase
MPRLAINTFVWHSPVNTEELIDVARRIAGWGYDAIEIPIENPGDWDPDAVAGVFAELDLLPVICAVMPEGRDLVATTDDAVAATQDYLRHCVDVAEAVGAQRVVGPIYAAVGRTWRVSEAERAAMMGGLREALRPVADHAGEHGVVLGLEPLNRYETSVITTVAQALDVIDGLPAESIGVAPDTYHMNIEEKRTPEAIRAIGDRLVHIQVCGPDRGAPGPDHLDWPGIRAALQDVGYDGVLGIESFTAENETIATAASIWRPLAPTQDELAVNGLAFLKEWSADWVAGTAAR